MVTPTISESVTPISLSPTVIRIRIQMREIAVVVLSNILTITLVMRATHVLNISTGVALEDR